MIVHRDQHAAVLGQRVAGGEHGLGHGMAEARRVAHDLAGAAHLRAQARVHARELVEGHHLLLDEEPVHRRGLQDAQVAQREPGLHPGRHAGDVHARGLAHERHRAAGAGVDLEDQDVVFLHGILHVHQAAHLQGAAQLLGGPADEVQMVEAHLVRGQHAGAVAGVDAGLLDVLHHAHEHHVLAVGHRIDVHLVCVLDVLVDEHGRARRDRRGCGQETVELGFVIGDGHGAAAQDEARAHQHRVADLPGDVVGLVAVVGQPPAGMVDLQLAQQGAEPAAILGQVQAVGRGAPDGHAGGGQAVSQVDGRLAAELHQRPVGPLAFHDAQHVLQGERLEVEAVGGVVVGGDGLGVAVDHDGLVAQVAQGPAGLDAAGVELDALADAVGAAAEDHGLGAPGGRGVAAALVVGVEIGCGGGELAGAGVHLVVAGAQRPLLAAGADVALPGAAQAGEGGVAQAVLLGPVEQFGRERGGAGDLPFVREDPGQLGEEPPIPAAARRRAIDGVGRVQVGAQPGGQVGQPADRGAGEQPGVVGRAGVGEVGQRAAEAVQAGVQAAQGLVQGLGEGAADGHDLAHRLHLRTEGGVHLGELLEVPAGDLHHAVVQAGLEAGGGGAGDVVGHLVEGQAHGELGGQLGDGKAGRLARQRGRPRDAWIHLDDEGLAGPGMHRELDVAAAGLHVHGLQDPAGEVAQVLLLLVGEGHGRRHGERVAGVHAHGVQVLDGADGHEVVGAVAHDLQLELLPAGQRPFHQDLAHRALAQAVGGQLAEARGVGGHAAAGAAEGEAGPHQDRKADLPGGGLGPGHAGAGDARRDRHAGLLHGLAEGAAVLGQADGRQPGADELHPVPGEGAALGQLDGQVQAGLAAHGGQQGVGPLAGDDGLHQGRMQRLDVRGVGQSGVGHDGGRVAVDQDHPVAQLAQHLAGLHAGVVELAALADGDGPGAGDQDGADVLTPRHDAPPGAGP